MSGQTQPNLRDKVKHVQEIADSIVHVSKAMKDLNAGRLNEKALLVLLARSTGLSQVQVKKVLDGLSELEETYLKPLPK